MFICSESENHANVDNGVDSFNILEALGVNYDVLEQVLEFLPYADLIAVSEACNSLKNWSECIKGTLAKRLTLSKTFMWSQKCTHVDNSIYIKPSLCFAFLNLSNPVQPLKLCTYACIHKNGQEVKKHGKVCLRT